MGKLSGETDDEWMERLIRTKHEAVEILEMVSLGEVWRDAGVIAQKMHTEAGLPEPTTQYFAPVLVDVICQYADVVTLAEVGQINRKMPAEFLRHSNPIDISGENQPEDADHGYEGSLNKPCSYFFWRHPTHDQYRDCEGRSVWLSTDVVKQVLEGLPLHLNKSLPDGPQIPDVIGSTDEQKREAVKTYVRWYMDRGRIPPSAKRRKWVWTYITGNRDAADKLLSECVPPSWKTNKRA